MGTVGESDRDAEHPELWPARKCSAGGVKSSQQKPAALPDETTTGTVIPQELVIATLNIQPVRVPFDPF